MIQWIGILFGDLFDHQVMLIVFLRDWFTTFIKEEPRDFLSTCSGSMVSRIIYTVSQRDGMHMQLYKLRACFSALFIYCGSQSGALFAVSMGVEWALHEKNLGLILEEVLAG